MEVCSGAEVGKCHNLGVGWFGRVGIWVVNGFQTPPQLQPLSQDARRTQGDVLGYIYGWDALRSDRYPGGLILSASEDSFVGTQATQLKVCRAYRLFTR